MPWWRYLVLSVVLVGAAVVAFVLMTSLLPRWWAGTLGRQAAGTISGGIGWGVFYGFVLTLVPLLVAGMAFVRRWESVRTRLIFIVAGVVLAIPNLTTLGIAVGTGDAAHAAERTLDVQAPGFRQATLIAAVAAALIAVTVWVIGAIRRRALAELKRLRVEHDARGEVADADERADRRALRAEAKAAGERTRGRP